MAKIQSVTAFSPDGQVLAYAGGDRIELRFRVQPIAQMSWRILFSPDGKFLAVCGSGGAKLIINVASGEVPYALPGVSGAFDLAFGGEGQYLAAAGPDPTIVIRNAATGKVWHTLKGHLAEVIALDAGTADNTIASGSIDGAVRLWDPETGACLAPPAPPGPYAGMNITGATGITPAQQAALMVLGAVEK